MKKIKTKPNKWKDSGNEIILFSIFCYLIINSKTYGIKYSILNLEHLNNIKKHTWYVTYDPTINNFYVQTNIRENGKQKLLRLHNLIINPPRDKEIDHIDRNPLNNLDENLRIVDHRINCYNRGLYKNNISGYKYINYHKRDKKYHLRLINKKGKLKSLGYYNTLKEAKEKRDYLLSLTEYSHIKFEVKRCVLRLS